MKSPLLLNLFFSLFIVLLNCSHVSRAQATEGTNQYTFQYLDSRCKQNNLNPSNSMPAGNILKDAICCQQQAAYTGIMKRYRISSRWSGTLLIGYNFLWQYEGYRSPFLLRFGWAR